MINAQKDGNQTLKELSALESSQLAAALRFMTQLVTTVSHAQMVRLVPTVIPDVSQDNAPVSIRSLELEKSAISAENVRRDPPQIN